MVNRTHARESRTTLPFVPLSAVQSNRRARDLSCIASTRIRVLPSSDLYTPQSAGIVLPAGIFLTPRPVQTFACVVGWRFEVHEHIEGDRTRQEKSRARNNYLCPKVGILQRFLPNLVSN